MKRHHIAALFLLIFGGLFAYLRFYTGDTDGAIRTGYHLYPTRSTPYFSSEDCSPGSDLLD